MFSDFRHRLLGGIIVAYRRLTHVHSQQVSRARSCRFRRGLRFSTTLRNYRFTTMLGEKLVSQ
jgi:hypothetical protein